LFSGCSYVYGTGLENNYQNPNHFSNILANNFFGAEHYIHNIGVPGYSNERIFLDSLHYLTKNHYDYAFICWTSLSRYVFWLGLELYESRRSFTPGSSFPIEHNGNDISWSSSQLGDFQNKFLLLNHQHYYIRDLVDYVNILIDVAKSKGTKIFFINSLLPWDQYYFDHIDKNVLPSMLTNYTNELLNSDSRNDTDINLLYQMIHNHYIDNGGIQEEHWLNLYQSFYNMMIDFGDDNVHPGIKSHQLFANMLIKNITATIAV
jgi:hypothetical protein